MKKKLIVYAVLALVVFGIFDWFHVSGREIEYAKDISPDCTVTVKVFGDVPAFGWEEESVHTLGPAGTEALKELLLSSSFRRSLAKTMTWRTEEDEHKYDILVDFNDGQRFISIHLTNNMFISVTDQFGGDFLMIGKNADFEKQLIHILVSVI